MITKTWPTAAAEWLVRIDRSADGPDLLKVDTPTLIENSAKRLSPCAHGGGFVDDSLSFSATGW